MTYEICTPLNRGRSFRKVSEAISGPACLILSVLLGSGFLYARLVPAPSAEEPRVAASEDMPVGALAPIAMSNPYGELLDPKSSLGVVPTPFAQSAPLRASFETIQPAAQQAFAQAENVVQAPVPEAPQLLQNVPVPMPRPTDLLAQALNNQSKADSRHAAQAKMTAPPPAATNGDGRSFFAKLFGMGSDQPSGSVLAYANPEDGAVRSAPSSVAPQAAAPAGSYDRYTAVYDISARVVYMPDGKRLEAHSGLGDRLDDPRYVSERMRGATPPHVYDLTLRESLFHGVQALRLTPVGDGDVYGRAGLLVHRYMLGPNGDSNGCVSVKDYEAFLQAYRNGEIKRLAVVARLN
jgi:Tlde1 domain